MKKPITFSVLFFIITSISSFGQGVWIEEEFSEGGPQFGLKTGKIEVNGNVYEIKPNANLEGANLEGANLSKARLNNVERDTLDLFNLNKINIIQSQMEEGGIGGGISPEQAAAIAANTTKIDALISDVTTQLETLGNNDTAIGEQLTALGQNDISIGEQMTTLSENDQILSANDEFITEQMACLLYTSPSPRDRG